MIYARVAARNSAGIWPGPSPSQRARASRGVTAATRGLAELPQKMARGGAKSDAWKRWPRRGRGCGAGRAEARRVSTGPLVAWWAPAGPGCPVPALARVYDRAAAPRCLRTPKESARPPHKQKACPLAPTAPGLAEQRPSPSALHSSCSGWAATRSLSAPFPPPYFSAPTPRRALKFQPPVKTST